MGLTSSQQMQSERQSIGTYTIRRFTVKSLMAKTAKILSDPSKVVGYIRVSSQDQADSGLGLAAQRTTIEAQCAARCLTLVTIREDAGLSGKNVNRPGLSAALKDVESGGVGGIVVSKLDRLSRSLKDFADLMDRAQKTGWNLIACDLGIDLSTPSGEFMANVMSSAAQWERRIISQRTKEALAEKRAAGASLGRPKAVPTDVVSRILSDRQTGRGLTAIAEQLNEEGVPTAHGGARWYASTVRAVLLAS